MKSESGEPVGKVTGWATAGLLALLSIHAGLLAWSAFSNSVTYDEYAHLPAGCAYWKYRAFEIYNLSPPLLRLWGALPAVAAGAIVPDPAPLAGQALTDLHWSYGEEFLKANAGRYQELFVLGRLAMILISCAGLWMVWLCARRLYGDRAALAAGLLYAFNPDLLAHGSIVGTDAGTAVAILGVTWLWWRYCTAPSVRRGASAALIVLIALLCKFTALLVWPMMIAVALCVLLRDHARWKAMLAGLGVCVLVAWLGVNLVYGFAGSFARLDSYELYSDVMKSIQRTLPAATPVPLPAELVRGFDAQKWETEQNYPAYLLGQVYAGSRWGFYPIVLACKLPVGVILLIAIAVVSVFMRAAAFKPPSLDELPFLAAILTFALGVALLANANIGVRYILPIYPLSFILIARLWGEAPKASGLSPGKTANASGLWSRARWAILTVAVIEALVVAPRFLSFVNLAWGGSKSGWKIVADSNFDWGQSLIDLRRWMAANHQSRICMAYFGRVDPRVYGIEFSPITAPGEEPYVAISSYFLVGLRQRVRTPEGVSEFMDLPYAPELRRMEPVAVAGRTLFVYARGQLIEAAQQARARLEGTRRDSP